MFTNNVKFFQKAVIFHPMHACFLTLKRVDHHTSAPGQWDFPGGGIDFGELHSPALAREIWEETRLTVVNPQVLEVMTRFDAVLQIFDLYRSSMSGHPYRCDLERRTHCLSLGDSYGMATDGCISFAETDCRKLSN